MAGLLALCGLLFVLTPHFLTVSNLLNVMEQTAINAVVAVGMTFVIVSGGIDLSVGSIVALSGVVLASALHAGWPVPLAIGAGLPVGAGCGLVNGLLVTRGRLPPFIATLGLMSVARGAALVYTEGRPISGFEAGFRQLATGRLLGIPAPVILTALVYLAAHFVLTRTRFGRYVYAIGGNEEATRLSGVPVAFHKTMVYALAGATSGLAAATLTARLNSAQPIVTTTREFFATSGLSLAKGTGFCELWHNRLSDDAGVRFYMMKVAVVGGGLSGMLTAYELVAAGCQVGAVGAGADRPGIFLGRRGDPLATLSVALP